MHEQELRERTGSPGAGSPEARHSRDTVPFSRTVRSTALGSMAGGTATQHAESSALCSHPVQCRGARLGTLGRYRVLGEQQLGSRTRSHFWEGTTPPQGATASLQVS